MKQSIKVLTLAITALVLGACGKMGELESVKTQAIDKQTTQQVAPAPEMQMMPHNSK